MLVPSTLASKKSWKPGALVLASLTNFTKAKLSDVSMGAGRSSPQCRFKSGPDKTVQKESFSPSLIEFTTLKEDFWPFHAPTSGVVLSDLYIVLGTAGRGLQAEVTEAEGQIVSGGPLQVPLTARHVRIV